MSVVAVFFSMLGLYAIGGRGGTGGFRSRGVADASITLPTVIRR
jgi:hypothetical protein